MMKLMRQAAVCSHHHPGRTQQAMSTTVERLLAAARALPEPLAWIELHQDELDAAWQLAVNGFRPGKIAPLK